MNDRLPDGVRVNIHDILAIRLSHQIDDDRRYRRQGKFGSPQYSDAFAVWIVEQHKENAEFFRECRERYYQQTHSGEREGTGGDGRRGQSEGT